MVYSLCHGLVEGITIVPVSCLLRCACRCAIGFVEDAIPRVMPKGAHTLTHQVTCPNPALHTVHDTAGPHTFP